MSFFQGTTLVSGATTFTFTNRCGGTVWPGVLANAGSPALDTTGFALVSGESRSLSAPPGWSGRFWARTGCAFDSDAGSGKCATGDCGTGEAECHGAGAAPPATLIEFTLAGAGAPKQDDYYDVSLVDGYNVPVVVEAAGCPATGCAADLDERCPPELRATGGSGCRSACEAFGRPEDCCSGPEFGSPGACRPSAYSQVFKAACPRAYSYAYDDATSTFTCSGSGAYSVTFCPRAGATLSSQKSSMDPTMPRPNDLDDSARLAADSWLASLATGETDAATTMTAASAFQAALAAATVVALLVSH